jgi:exonuclease III
MEEVIWIGMKDWLVKEVKICVGFLYCPPVNSKWFNVNFLRDFQEDINMLRDRYANTEILIMGDFNCRTGEEQIKLQHLFDFWEDSIVEKENSSERRHSKDKSCNVEGKKLIQFCELNNFEMLNGKYGLDIR